jgi:uncharacterized membrane protein YjdF
MSRPYTIKNALHRDSALSIILEKIGDDHYFAVVPVRPSTVVISSVTTTDANWTLTATGLVDILSWRLSELNGNDFHYAFEAVPGDNFSVAYGWVGDQTNPVSIYIKRPSTGNVTVKFERWTI